ncbi:HNH endonuclease [Rhizobium sullae]|nr:HNH endonuclease [Rhizobium sullae]
MWDTNPQEFIIVRYGISAGLAKRFQCTAEHVEARRDGGTDVAPNIVAACLFCNTTRHKAKHPVDAAKHASVVRSRLAKGRWRPPQVKAAFSERAWPPI